jgi:hypothetical protein
MEQTHLSAAVENESYFSRQFNNKFWNRMIESFYHIIDDKSSFRKKKTKDQIIQEIKKAIISGYIDSDLEFQYRAAVEDDWIRFAFYDNDMYFETSEANWEICKKFILAALKNRHANRLFLDVIRSIDRAGNAIMNKELTRIYVPSEYEKLLKPGVKRISPLLQFREFVC